MRILNNFWVWIYILFLPFILVFNNIKNFYIDYIWTDNKPWKIGDFLLKNVFGLFFNFYFLCFLILLSSFLAKSFLIFGLFIISSVTAYFMNKMI